MMIRWLQRVRNTWGLYGPRVPSDERRAAAWRSLWQTDKQRALQVCDEIVRQRDVPERLLRRLNVTTQGEAQSPNSRVDS